MGRIKEVKSIRLEEKRRREMTLDELIKEVDLYLPGNRFNNQQKTHWLNEIEGKIFDEIEARLGFSIYKKTFKLPAVVKIIRRADGAYDYARDQDEQSNDCSNSYEKEIDPLNVECNRNCCDQYLKYELVPYKYETDTETPLIAPDRFCDVYLHYILAKIHQADSEIDNYNNEVIIFSASYDDYAAYRIRQYR